MASTVINTREDLDAITGSPEHDAFMSMLRGTLYRLEKDDTATVWHAVEDNSVIERFGFTRSDFPGAVPPELPAYVPPPSDVPQKVTNYQAKVALDSWQLLDKIEAYMAKEDTPKRYKLAMASASFERQSDMVLGIAEIFGLTAEQVDQLFIIAGKVS